MNRLSIFVVLLYLLLISPTGFAATSPQELFQQRSKQIQWKDLSIEFRPVSDKAGRGLKAMTVRSTDQENGKTYYVGKTVLLSLKDISDMNTSYNPNEVNMLRLIFNFNQEGKKTLQDHTTKYLGEMMGVVIDGQLRLVAHIRQPLLNGRVQVYGFTANEAMDILRRYYQPHLELARKINEELAIQNKK